MFSGDCCGGRRGGWGLRGQGAEVGGDGLYGEEGESVSPRESCHMGDASQVRSDQIPVDSSSILVSSAGIIRVLTP